jgi:hypothetical protein
MDEGAEKAHSGQQRAEAVPHVHELASRTMQMGVHRRHQEASVDWEVAEEGESCGEERFPLQHRR